MLGRRQERPGKAPIRTRTAWGALPNGLGSVRGCKAETKGSYNTTELPGPRRRRHACELCTRVVRRKLPRIQGTSLCFAISLLVHIGSPAATPHALSLQVGTAVSPRRTIFTGLGAGRGVLLCSALYFTEGLKLPSPTA